MRILVTTFGCDGGRSGIGRYARSILRELGRDARGHDVEAWVHGDEVAGLVPDPGRVRVRRFPGVFRFPVLDVAWHQSVLPTLVAVLRPDVVFLPAANRRLPIRLTVPAVGTVHDFSSLHVAGKYDPARMTYIRHVLPLMMRGLDGVLTPSASTREDVQRYAGVPAARIQVTPLGVDRDLFRPEALSGAPAVLRKHGLERPYVLYVSRLEHPGKNHVGLIRAFGHLVAETGVPHDLVLVGQDWFRAEAVHEEARRSPAAARIRILGHATADELPALYAGAALFAFPSLYEGFGLPVLEAMASGTPVACADVSSLPEVAGDAAERFDPADDRAAAAAMARVLTDPVRAADLRRRGLARAARFTWERTASLTLDALEGVAGVRR